MALLTALFASALLMGLGLSLALVGSGEGALAARGRDAAAHGYAARAAAALAIAELRVQPSWAAVLRQGMYPEVSAAVSKLGAATEHVSGPKLFAPERCRRPGGRRASGRRRARP